MLVITRNRHRRAYDRPLSGSRKELQNIPIRILLNKTDLITDLNEAMLEELLEMYRNIGYPVLESSVVNERGLDELKQQLDQHISVFVGQSGIRQVVTGECPAARRECQN
ncbi:MAG: GTPase RsgA [Gammaproteobacteria bacterium]